MRHIIREAGKRDPIFDEDLNKDQCIFIDKSVRIGYISHNTDKENALVINLWSAEIVFVARYGSNFLIFTTF